MNLSDDIVYISKERLQQLEALEARLPRLVEEAVKEYKQKALQKLHEKDKENPRAVANRAKRYLERNRDAINERRREKRKLQRLVTEPSEVTVAPKVTKVYDYTLQNATTLSFE